MERTVETTETRSAGGAVHVDSYTLDATDRRRAALAEVRTDLHDLLPPPLTYLLYSLV